MTVRTEATAAPRVNYPAKLRGVVDSVNALVSGYGGGGHTWVRCTTCRTAQKGSVFRVPRRCREVVSYRNTYRSVPSLRNTSNPDMVPRAGASLGPGSLRLRIPWLYRSGKFHADSAFPSCSMSQTAGMTRQVGCSTIVCTSGSGPVPPRQDPVRSTPGGRSGAENGTELSARAGVFGSGSWRDAQARTKIATKTEATRISTILASTRGSGRPSGIQRPLPRVNVVGGEDTRHRREEHAMGVIEAYGMTHGSENQFWPISAASPLQPLPAHRHKQSCRR